MKYLRKCKWWTSPTKTTTRKGQTSTWSCLLRRWATTPSSNRLWSPLLAPSSWMITCRSFSHRSSEMRQLAIFRIWAQACQSKSIYLYWQIIWIRSPKKSPNKNKKSPNKLSPLPGMKRRTWVSKRNCGYDKILVS